MVVKRHFQNLFCTELALILTSLMQVIFFYAIAKIIIKWQHYMHTDFLHETLSDSYLGGFGLLHISLSTTFSRLVHPLRFLVVSP